MRYLYLLLFLVLFFYGCQITRQAVLDVQACKDDPVCFAEMQAAGQNSYIATKAVASAIDIPSIPEFIGLAVSNAVMFGVGWFKGRKKRTG